MSRFNKVGTTSVPGATLKAFSSPATGLRAILAETDEPLCSLHVAIATEADTNDWSHKDDGLPHTLEHAVFMGSELYPFKGILDKLANRSLADGTNAWTATDSTVYTLKTAGHRGLLNMLPIYADHILYPTLSDACFTTEVHHVTGEGEDKGVVYCEMQGRENSDSSLIDRAVQDLLYPSGGYSAETGGKMANLRSLTNAQVCRYHKENYRADNMVFIVSGLVDEAEFCAAMAQVEERVLAKQAAAAASGGGVDKMARRPWSGPLAPMPSPGLDGGGVLVCDSGSGALRGTPRTIAFPSEDESVGSVSMAWRGPTFDDVLGWQALKALQKYLTDSAASPLVKAFVECADPLCGDVGPASEVFTEGYHQLWFEDAEVASMEQIPAAFFEALRKARDDFSMERMGLILRRLRRTHLSSIEKDATDALTDGLIQYFLYADASDEAAAKGLRACCDPLETLPALAAMPKSEWQGLLTRWFLDRPCACVIGKPSAARAKEIADVEASRTKQQAEELGAERLQALAAALEAAQAENNREIANEILESVPIPSKGEVRSIPLLTVRGGGATPFAVAEGSGAGVEASVVSTLLQKLPPAGAPAPYWLEVSQVDSAFLTLAVAFDTTPVPPILRLYLPLLLELLWKASCTLEDGTRLSKDAFVAALEDDTVSYSSGIGLPRAGVNQLASASLKLELEGDATLDKGLAWMRRALYLTSFSRSNVRMTAKKLLSGLPGTFRNGNAMKSHVHSAITMNADDANTVADSPMRQQPFLQTLMARLESTDGTEHVLAQLASLRAMLVVPSRMQFLLAGSVTTLTDPYAKLVRAIHPPSSPPVPIGDDEEEEAAASTAADGDGGEEEGEGEGEGEGDMEEADGGEGGKAAKKPPPAKAGPALEAMPLEAEAARVPTPPSDAPVGLVTGVNSHLLQLPTPTMGGAVVGLSAIENSYLVLSAPGLGPYHPDVAALRVVIEHLTALEGDFWVKLRGAGLTYGSGLNNLSDAKELQLTFYRCADAAAAYAAAKGILADYASGQATISQTALDGAKSSLAYNQIARTASKPSAVASQWAAGYTGVAADYTSWLLGQVDRVTAEDALHALKVHLTPLFDASAVLVATAPKDKAADLCKALGEEHCGEALPLIAEEELTTVFGAGGAGAPRSSAAGVASVAGATPMATPTPTATPTVVAGGSRKRAGKAAFSFAKQFKCECPKCDPTEKAKKIEGGAS